MNNLSLVSPDFFNLHASSYYAGRPAKVEKSEQFSFHYKNPLGCPFANFWCFLNLNLYSNWCFKFEFAFGFRTYILHTHWSRSQTNDLSADVRTFFEKRTSFHLPLSPCKRACYHTYFVAIILSADENDQNKYLLCGKAMTTRGHLCKGGGEGAEKQLEGWMYV